MALIDRGADIKIVDGNGGLKEMSVSGIGVTTGYLATGYETRKTERNVAGEDFATKAAQATAILHGAEEG